MRTGPGNPPPAVEVSVDPRRLVVGVAVVWVAVVVGLVVLDGAVVWGGLGVSRYVRRVVDMSREDSLANFLAVLQTLLLALTLWAVYLTVRGRGASRWRRRGWALAAGFFTLVAIDDGAALHERLGTALGSRVEGWVGGAGDEPAVFYPSHPWQIVLGPAFVALGLSIAVFLWRELETRGSRALLVAGLGCLGVGLALDFLEGLAPEHPLNPWSALGSFLDFSESGARRFRDSPYAGALHLGKVAEEAIEMLGITLLWVAVLRDWTRRTSELRVRFARR